MSEEIILRSKSASFEIPIISVGEYLINKLEKLEDKTCLIEAKTGNELSVKQLISKANSIAIALLKRGITKSDIFQCFSANNLEYAITQFAIYFLGNTSTPAAPTSGIFELKSQIRISGSTIIFTSVTNAHIIDKIINDQNNNSIRKQIKLVIVFGGTYNDFLPFSQLLSEGENEKLNRIPYFEINPKDDLFSILFTSGTTGLPKGAMITHFCFTARLEGLKQFFGNRYMKTAGIYPFGHASGNITFPSWVSSGQTIVIYEEMNEEIILNSVEKYKINFLPIFPSFGYRLIDGDLKDKYDLSSVEIISTAGSIFSESVAKRIIEKYKVTFREIYSMTEYSGPLMNPHNIIGCVGSVSANTELKIIDLNTGQSLGPNIDGEICLRGPKLFSGYLNNESATKASIDINGWFHTGDIGHYDHNERLYITDRLKEIIKFRHWSIYPEEIRSLLMTHKFIEDVFVVGVKHETDGQLPRAYVKVKNGFNVTEDELIIFVEDNMAFQNRLRAGVRFVDEIPRNILGKVDQKYLENLLSK